MCGGGGRRTALCLAVHTYMTPKLSLCKQYMHGSNIGLSQQLMVVVAHGGMCATYQGVLHMRIRNMLSGNDTL